MDVNKYISKQFKRLRILNGFTQADIADILKCSRINVVRMEKGQNGFTPITIYILCCIFECTPDDLMPPIPLNNKYLKYAQRKQAKARKLQ